MASAKFKSSINRQGVKEIVLLLSPLAPRGVLAFATFSLIPFLEPQLIRGTPGWTRMGPLATNAAAGHPQTSLPTINDLPIEVFHLIVSLVARKEHVDGHDYDLLRALRLVATLWSTLIDDCPQFWSTISSSDPEPVWRMALQKSKQAEIDVDCAKSSILSMRNDFPTTLTKAIVIHTPRVRKLDLLDRDFDYLLSNASITPCLRSLYLRGSTTDHDPIALPLHPVNWAPNLRNVTLDLSHVILKGLLWDNLEGLTIYNSNSLPMEDVIATLAASPGFRYLDLGGPMQPRCYSHQRLIPTVKLEALESLIFHIGQRRGTPFEALGSIITSPKEVFWLVFQASDENLRPENLRSIGRFASRIADGEAEIALKLVVGKCRNHIEMGGFDVEITSHEDEVPNPLAILTHILEGLPPQSLLAVKTAEIRRTEPSLVLGLLPIISSFFPNTSHLIITALDGDLASSIGGRNTDGWIFPQLESLSILHYRGGHHARKAIEPRLKALESGEQLAKLKRLCLPSVRAWNMDEAEIAELNALVPEVIVNLPDE
ncbi:hypothetical protein M407DRAFT_232905 [Tulasnella calospora MUT 4182]|uniref:F-box domain-containing protein n=1 Tax=Tulasnella calospora MUT 4182 TaxID=1051891 RepID=A0A0C3L3D8_9AGAM|nr:hypothetical protein M407DRAFT_232905 [Tulasnella calospora MUT 4182]